MIVFIASYYSSQWALIIQYAEKYSPFEHMSELDSLSIIKLGLGLGYGHHFDNQSNTHMIEYFRARMQLLRQSVRAGYSSHFFGAVPTALDSWGIQYCTVSVNGV